MPACVKAAKVEGFQEGREGLLGDGKSTLEDLQGIPDEGTPHAHIHKGRQGLLGHGKSTLVPLRIYGVPMMGVPPMIMRVFIRVDRVSLGTVRVPSRIDGVIVGGPEVSLR